MSRTPEEPLSLTLAFPVHPLAKGRLVMRPVRQGRSAEVLLQHRLSLQLHVQPRMRQAADSTPALSPDSATLKTNLQEYAQILLISIWPSQIATGPLFVKTGQSLGRKGWLHW